MNQKIHLLDGLFAFGVAVLVFLAPLVFWDLTSENFQTPKFLILILITSTLLAIWTLKSLITGRVTLTKTPANISLVLLLIVVLVSTFFSTSTWSSLLGSFPRNIHESTVALAVYILLFFTVTSNLKLSTVKYIVLSLIASGTLVAIVSLLSFFGAYILPLEWTKVISFSLTGSGFSTAAFLMLLLPFLLNSLLDTHKEESANNLILGSVNYIAAKVVVSSILVLFIAVIVWTGPLITQILAGSVLLITLILSTVKSIKQSATFLIPSVIICGIIFGLAVAPVSWKGFENPIYPRVQSFQKDIQLPLGAAWKISISAFRDHPFFGSGPSTFITNFTAYKPIEFNTTNHWNVRFDQSYNEYLQFLANLGALGFVLFSIISLLFVSLAFKTLRTRTSGFESALSLAVIAFFALLVLHTATLVVWTIGIVILGLFFVVAKQYTEEIHFGIATTSSSDNNLNLRFDIFPLVLTIISLTLIAGSLYYIGRFTIADFHRKQALAAVTAGDGLQAYNQLVKAEGLNPYADLYRLELAQTNFALANAIASSKGPSESSPTGSLTDQDKQNIEAFLSQSINEGKVAVALNPKSAANWEMLGSIYRQISGVTQNALAFALDSYGQAIQNDPLNPTLRVQVGGIYYATQNYDMAVRFFSDSINLKSDYANGYYNLALALREKGDTATAIAVTEQMMPLLEPDSADYDIATNLLSELQAKSESLAKEEKPSTYPTKTSSLEGQNEQTSALQNKSLPKVLELPEPEKVATPDAVPAEE